MLFTRLLTCFDPYPYIHIHPYTFHIYIYIIYIYISFLLWTSHFCCLNPPFNDRVLRRAPTRWCRRCSRSMAGGPEPMRPDHLARKQALRLRALWGTKITWWLVEILESWANVQFLGAFFSRKICEYWSFFDFFSEMKISKWVETKNLGCRVETS